MPARWRAASIHFGIGAVLAALAYGVVRLAWYPDALFHATNASGPLWMVLVVLLIAGPLAMAIVYIPGKRGLKFDVVAIALLQVTGAGYGLWTLFESRPAYIVFVKDRFELVHAGEFPVSEIARAPESPFLRLPIAGPGYAGARMPTERAEIERVMFLAPSGLDLHHMPKHYVPYSEVSADAARRGEPIARLRALNPKAAPEVEALVRDARLPEEGLAFLPLRAGDRDLTVLIERRTGAPRAIAALRPWEY